MKKIALILLLVSLFSLPAFSQFENEKSYAGASVGLSFLGSTPVFGLNYEYALKTDIGLLGIGGIFRYWSYSEDYYWGAWKYTDIAIGVQGNYHYDLFKNKKLDTYVGAVIAYDAGSVSSSYNALGYHYNWSSPSYGGIYLQGQAGARYFVSKSMAITGRFGFGSGGYGSIEAGVDIKF